MWNDAIDLRDFYATPLGGMARRLITRRLRLMWPDVRGFNVLGLGYATPFLGVFRGEAERVVSLAPAPQGVLHWPGEGEGLTALVDENGLPLPDRAFDRVLVVHALECAEQTQPMMREVWRVMTDGGRLIIVVPNRRGLWAQFERTPFGYGRPYSTGQLARGLRQAMFTPNQSRAALFLPPFQSRMMLSSAGPVEEIGERWFKRFAGVVVFEATKQIYAGRIVFGREASAPGYLAMPTR